MWRGAPDNSTKIDLLNSGARYAHIIHCQGWATSLTHPSYTYTNIHTTYNYYIILQKEYITVPCIINTFKFKMESKHKSQISYVFNTT